VSPEYGDSLPPFASGEILSLVPSVTPNRGRASPTPSPSLECLPPKERRFSFLHRDDKRTSSLPLFVEDAQRPQKYFFDGTGADRYRFGGSGATFLVLRADAFKTTRIVFLGGGPSPVPKPFRSTLWGHEFSAAWACARLLPFDTPTSFFLPTARLGGLPLRSIHRCPI